ncbi:ubiquitin C-terminal hydrolase 12, partial [Gastrolobium bilobum]|uniref:ubiquitin C-terminal hydrolase 12 n=1 Tax=Gastrolobium bilobum TaxID=150636 RepID=UPI002AB08937
MDGGISRSTVDAPPTHYLMKVQSFSLLAKNSIERYESGNFEAGGYKWKLVLYPIGNKSKNVKDHISLYLALDEAGSLQPGWEIYVNFRLFLFDQNNDNFLAVQDGVKKEKRFHKMKIEWGFDQFIPLKDFILGSKGNYWFSASNNENGASRFISISNFTSQNMGYLVKDICLVEAEVTVLGVVDA